jgi:hypothetical protein
VIALLASDESLTRSFTTNAVIRDRDLQRGVDSLGAGVREEHVIDVAGRELDQPARKLEAGRVAHLERRRVLHRGQLLAHRLGDFLATVAGVDTPESCDAVEHFASVFGPVVHALGAREQARLRLELTVGSERHPERFKIGTRGGWHGRKSGNGGGDEDGPDDKKIRQAAQILRKLFIALGPECRLS